MKHRVPHDCQIPDPIERREIFTLDQVYDFYFDRPSVFVEVGAYDGYSHSNTALLAEDGWKGLYIEAVSDYAKLCRKNHSKHDVIVLNTAIHSRECEVAVTKQGEWSRTEETEVSETSVKAKTLDTVLTKYKCPPDLLVIDVEGNEYNVLLGSNLDKWAPVMCIIELHEEPSYGWDTASNRKLIEDVSNYMEKAGYTKVYFDYINTIFIRSDILESKGNFFQDKDWKIR